MESIKSFFKKHKTIRIVIWAVSLLSIIANILFLHALYCRPEETIDLNNIVSFIGICFSIVGVVATIYFVVIAYRTRNTYEELVKEKEKAETAINEAKTQWEGAITEAKTQWEGALNKAKIQWEKLVQSELYVIYNNFSFLTNQNPDKITEYQLLEARMVCHLKLLKPEERLEKIELLGTIGRQKPGPEWEKIDEDIKLLEDVVFDNDEPLEIKQAALIALNKLQKKKNN
jgi:hypothetical protein